MYEEMYSNWKNKMTKAAGRNDVYSSFMNLLSLQYIFHKKILWVAIGGNPLPLGGGRKPCKLLQKTLFCATIYTERKPLGVITLKALFVL